MKYFFTIIIIALSHILNAQIEKTQKPTWTTLSEIKSLGSHVASLKYAVENNDTTYIILFNNLEYTHITDVKSIIFKDEGGVLKSLYQILSETLDSENGKENTFKLGKQDITATCVKVPGMKSVNIRISENGANFGLTRKQLDKLFSIRH